jgi:chaperonin GroEL (HSP60 family)
LVLVCFFLTWEILSNNPEAFKKDLINIAKTTLSSKVLSQNKDFFSNLAVDAVLRLKVGTRKQSVTSTFSWNLFDDLGEHKLGAHSSD